MKCAFAAWLTSWSRASVTKSMNMISTTGLRPAWAAPTAIPATALSLIGVLRTRPRPNSSASPSVARYGPPSATSSPITTTRSSARIAWASAPLMALTYVVSMSGIDELGRVGRGQRLAGPAEFDGGVDLGIGVGGELPRPLLVEPALLPSQVLQLG